MFFSRARRPTRHSRAARADLFEHQHRVLVDRDALIVDAAVEIRAWSSEDHGAAPVRKEVRQTIGPKISSNFWNGITDFWKTVRRAERLLPRGKELCVPRLGYRVSCCLLCWSLVIEADWISG